MGHAVLKEHIAKMMVIIAAPLVHKFYVYLVIYHLLMPRLLADIDCSEVVKAAPVCADPSWGLYEADGNGDILFCCLPDAYGLPGSGCVASSASGTPSQVASSASLSLRAPPNYEISVSRILC